MAAVLGLASVIVALLLAALSWQHFRYLRRRRGGAQDRQPLLYGPGTFHVVTLAKLPPEADLFGKARQLVAALEAAGARAVYAGKRLVIALPSRQLPEVEWDMALLSQYASRDSYRRARERPEVKAALAAFERTFDQGFRRSALLNMAVPALLLARRLADILRRRPARLPFKPAEAPPSSFDVAERERRLAPLRDERQPGREAVVVVNFTKRGTPEQRARDAAYVRAMLGLMAEGGHGPMHLGRAVTVEGDASFDSVALAYYPGRQYFADMASSSFYAAIIGNKQLGDTLAMITAPFLDRL